MGIYCNRDIYEALSGLDFPATKEQIVTYATEHNAPEAVNVSLNALPEGVRFADLGAVCENVSIVCTLDVYRALEGIRFPATKAEMIAYAVGHTAPEDALAALRALSPQHRYLSISEVCRNVLVEEEEPAKPLSTTLLAVYENGVFRPLEQVEIPEHWRVRLVVEPLGKA